MVILETERIPLISERALYFLYKMLEDHGLVNALVTSFTYWDELYEADAATRAYKAGPWAVKLQIPQTPDPLPSFGAGVESTSKYARTYPQRLTDLFDAPTMLYRRSRVPDGPYVAIGGSFFPSAFGLEVARSAAVAAAKAKKPVVALLDNGIGSEAIRVSLELKNKVLAVASGDLKAPSQHTETIGQILENHGSIISEWSVGDSWSEEKSFQAQRLVAAMGSIIVLAELGTHPAGGADFAKAAVGTGRFLVVPEPPKEEYIGASYTGLAIFGRARSFSPKVFGAHPRMLARVANGVPAADFIVTTEEELVNVFKETLT